MDKQIIDAHIHLNLYEEVERDQLMANLGKNYVSGLVAVSENLASAKKLLRLKNTYPNIYPTFGYHPEQALPSTEEINALFDFIDGNIEKMVAIGEVGLPYYLRKKDTDICITPYIKLLALFIEKARIHNKPIVLHAVYTDAPIVCDLLEKYRIKKAHFHWFKGDKRTIQRMIQNGYHISITPDVLYEAEIQALVKVYPLDLMMVETDGPWQFEDVFKNKRTDPVMIHDTIAAISKIKQINEADVYQKLFQTTKDFYNIK